MRTWPPPALSLARTVKGSVAIAGQEGAEEATTSCGPWMPRPHQIVLPEFWWGGHARALNGVHAYMGTRRREITRARLKCRRNRRRPNITHVIPGRATPVCREGKGTQSSTNSTILNEMAPLPEPLRGSPGMTGFSNRRRNRRRLWGGRIPASPSRASTRRCRPLRMNALKRSVLRTGAYEGCQSSTALRLTEVARLQIVFIELKGAAGGANVKVDKP